MPDMTLCLNKSCKMKSRCYRYLAKPMKKQSYANFNPNSDTDCNYFIAMQINNIAENL